jgi:hypothetical protein
MPLPHEFFQGMGPHAIRKGRVLRSGRKRILYRDFLFK